MSKKSKNKKLTAKQERFCYEYLANGFNATQAAIKAGYSERTAKSIGQENLTKPDIKSKIDEMKSNLAETAGISALMIAREHSKIAFSSISHLHNTWIERKQLVELTDEQKACIQEISTKVIQKNIGSRTEPDIVDVEFIKIKLYDKQKALDALSNLFGYNAPTKQELTGKNGKDLMPPQDLSSLSDEELITYYTLLKKAGAKKD